jgi:hypothetical protein
MRGSVAGARARDVTHAGLTHVTTRVRPLGASKKFFEAEFLVDTGAVDCLAPATALKRIGVRPEG